MAPDLPAETITTAAIAQALIEAANDFGEGNQIAGDVWKLAGAALEAAAPAIRVQERERIRVRLAAGISRRRALSGSSAYLLGNSPMTLMS